MTALTSADQSVWQSYVGAHAAFYRAYAELFAPGVDLRCIGWLPDFQHWFMPEMFNADEIGERNVQHGAVAAGSARMILSSRAVERQFAAIYPEHAHKTRVASFPSHFAFNPPTGDQAVRLWQHVTGWLEFPNLYELQRPKSAADVDAIVTSFASYLEARDWLSVQRETP